MRLFISWSQEPSRSYANAFRNWIGDVFQSVKPFMSSIDIDAGEPWLSLIQETLSASDFGVAFVTADNISSQWMHYEAGAIAKATGRAKLIPILCGIDLLQLQTSPMNFFQAKQLDESGIFDICKAVNGALGDQSLSSDALNRAFRRCWPELKETLRQVEPEPKTETAPRDPLRSAIDALTDRIGTLTRVNSQFIELHMSLLRPRTGENALSGISHGILPKNDLAENDIALNALAERPRKPSGRGLASAFEKAQRGEDEDVGKP